MAKTLIDLVDMLDWYRVAIKNAWCGADREMADWQSRGCGIQTGGYEKIARDERSYIRQLTVEFERDVVKPLLPLTRPDDELRAELRKIRTLLIDDAANLRRTWDIDRHEKPLASVAELAKAFVQARREIPIISPGDLKAVLKPLESLIGVADQWSVHHRANETPRKKSVRYELQVALIAMHRALNAAPRYAGSTEDWEQYAVDAMDRLRVWIIDAVQRLEAENSSPLPFGSPDHDPKRPWLAKQLVAASESIRTVMFLKQQKNDLELAAGHAIGEVLFDEKMAQRAERVEESKPSDDIANQDALVAAETQKEDGAGSTERVDRAVEAKPDAPALTFDERNLTASVRNETFALTEDQFYFLQAVVDAKGGIVAGEDTVRTEGQRPDQICKKLPEALRKMITSRRGNKGGYMFSGRKAAQ